MTMKAGVADCYEHILRRASRENGEIMVTSGPSRRFGRRRNVVAESEDNALSWMP